MDAVLDRIEKRGEDNGFAMSTRVFKLIQAGETDNNVITQKCNCTLEQVQKIRKEFDI